MRPVQIIGLLAAVIVVIVVLYSLRSGSSPEEYAALLKHERDEKDLQLKNGKDSPFSGKPFDGLKYFAPDARYRVRARIIPVENKKIISLPTSDGLEKEYLEYAYAEFEIDTVACRLLILEIIDNSPYRGTLFTAFADETSARETYGAGRYLDVRKMPGAGHVELDFNRAYNPYCAYSDNFSCPFPPKGNSLKVSIPAGEKIYH